MLKVVKQKEQFAPGQIVQQLLAGWAWVTLQGVIQGVADGSSNFLCTGQGCQLDPKDVVRELRQAGVPGG